MGKQISCNEIISDYSKSSVESQIDRCVNRGYVPQGSLQMVKDGATSYFTILMVRL